MSNHFDCLLSSLVNLDSSCDRVCACACVCVLDRVVILFLLLLLLLHHFLLPLLLIIIIIIILLRMKDRSSRLNGDSFVFFFSIYIYIIIIVVVFYFERWNNIITMAVCVCVCVLSKRFGLEDESTKLFDDRHNLLFRRLLDSFERALLPPRSRRLRLYYSYQLKITKRQKLFLIMYRWSQMKYSSHSTCLFHRLFVFRVSWHVRSSNEIFYNVFYPALKFFFFKKGRNGKRF